VPVDNARIALSTLATMSPRIVYTDQQLTDFSEEHLMYELNILRWLVETIPNTKKGFPLSAFLESFSIHMRNLIEFLYAYADPNNARADDAVAADFFDPPTGWNPGNPSASLSAARERANKEVGHITYKRKSGPDPTKLWPVTDLFNEILPVARKFADGASAKRLHRDVVTWVHSDENGMMVLVGAAATATTNTAVGLTSIGVGPGRKSG